MTQPRPKKSLGQNFLMHARIAERIVAAAQLPAGATVLEIGPGTGMLTRPLLAAGAHVVAVEADDALVPLLAKSFAPEIAAGSLTLVHGDIRSFDLGALAAGGPYHVVANIPYYITGEIMRLLLESPHKPASITVLVQKEVAERIARAAGKESVLSVSVAAYGTPEYAFTVPRGAFRPAPSVDSAVLAVRDIRPDAFADAAEERRFFAILKAGFAHKRKRLAKNLEAVLPRDAIPGLLDTAGIGADARPESVGAGQWRALLAAARTRDLHPALKTNP